ncbi:MAG: hypothetical protein K8R21_16190, partial [Leptospira sp.]|nr:hypothetical protein [Leptospira sp.]
NEVRKSKESAAGYLKALCQMEKPAWFQNASYLPVMYCGAPETFNHTAAIDIMQSETQFRTFSEIFSKAIREKRFGTVISDLDYKPEDLKVFISHVEKKIETTKNKNEASQLKNFLYGLKLELSLREFYREVPGNELSTAEREFLSYEKSVYNRTSHIYKSPK